MRQVIAKLVREQAAVTALEYALIAALVALAIIGSVSVLGTSASQIFSTAASTI
jgi:pilus assembly protein Flp/PilA